MHMQNNDATSFWALSTNVLINCLESVGFRDVRWLKLVTVPALVEHMSRFILVARKPETPSGRPYTLQIIKEGPA
jgi:hypothetical protein